MPGKEKKTPTENLAETLKNPFGEGIVGRALAALFGKAREEKKPKEKKPTPSGRRRVVPKPNPQQQEAIRKRR